ncbi:MAG: hypothetical protein Satyrvirus8_3 [Satyrvirus sp.]|uniref:Uncharacterized protein n=1 Tax=Satyrvirus sp. TaxID=2487771 RepID=A0A3G5ADE3_9VIRU|nr:MAG: hypothetical protein Satyrvirus8_3 [Satyrvirus sp.]
METSEKNEKRKIKRMGYCSCCKCEDCKDSYYVTQYCEKLSTYQGPELIKATYDNKDYLAEMKQIYGEQKNWNSKRWIAQDIFGEDCVGKEIYLEFKSANGHIHWMKGKITRFDEIINHGFGIPFDEKYNQK